jgi:molybdate transport system permease protein
MAKPGLANDFGEPEGGPRSSPLTVYRRRPGLTPVVGATAAVVALAFFVLPLAGLLHRAPWRDIVSELQAPEVGLALRLSLVCSLAATALSVVLGFPLAWLLARVTFPGRSVVRALTMLPMVLPPVVGGVALLFAFGRRGFVGQWLDSTFGITLPFTTWGVILAEAFVAMPFLVITVEAGLRSADRRLEEAAATLGASRWTTLRRVTLPLVAPSLAAGSMLAWARALGEFGATITFAGNLPGTTQTMPLAVYLLLESRPAGAIVLSLVLLAVSLAVLVLLRERWFPAAH